MCNSKFVVRTFGSREVQRPVSVPPRKIALQFGSNEVWIGAKQLHPGTFLSVCLFEALLAACANDEFPNHHKTAGLHPLLLQRISGQSTLCIAKLRPNS